MSAPRRTIWAFVVLLAVTGCAKQVLSPDLPSTASPPEEPPSRNATAARLATRYLGAPYVWAGSSPAGFDCSGLVMYAFGQVGVAIPHNAAQQFRLGVPVARDRLVPVKTTSDLLALWSDVHDLTDDFRVVVSPRRTLPPIFVDLDQRFLRTAGQSQRHPEREVKTVVGGVAGHRLGQDGNGGIRQDTQPEAVVPEPREHRPHRQTTGRILKLSRVLLELVRGRGVE